MNILPKVLIFGPNYSTATTPPKNLFRAYPLFNAKIIIFGPLFNVCLLYGWHAGIIFASKPGPGL